MDVDIINPCDITGCKEEGLHKTYTREIIEFKDGFKRNYIYQCTDHFIGVDEEWFAPAGSERGKVTPFLIEPVKLWPDPPKNKE